MRAAVVMTVATAATLVVAACNGDKGTPTGDTAPDDTGATTDAPTFTRVKAEVLSSCVLSGCHLADGNTTPIQPLSIPAGGEHAALVGVEAVDAPGQTLVVPGDPDASYLLAKMSGAPGIVGSPMPSPFGASEAQIQLVRDWISAGALDD